MRGWTGWQIALESIMALGPGRGRRDDGGTEGVTGTGVGLGAIGKWAGAGDGGC